MANETTPTPAPSRREMLAKELEAIKARCEKAATTAERKLVASQYGERLQHLADRIKELEETIGEGPGAPED